jgi:hypothetical protein
VSKKCLTGPTLLEMSGYATNQELCEPLLPIGVDDSLGRT